MCFRITHSAPRAHCWFYAGRRERDATPDSPGAVCSCCAVDTRKTARLRLHPLQCGSVTARECPCPRTNAAEGVQPNDRKQPRGTIGLPAGSPAPERRSAKLVKEKHRWSTVLRWESAFLILVWQARMRMPSADYNWLWSITTSMQRWISTSLILTLQTVAFKCME